MNHTQLVSQDRFLPSPPGISCVGLKLLGFGCGSQETNLKSVGAPAAANSSVITACAPTATATRKGSTRKSIAKGQVYFHCLSRPLWYVWHVISLKS